mgnify:CR=1 FL=1
MKDLSILREKINEIDKQIIELWKERMETCLSVAQHKKENNLPILDAKREAELLKLYVKMRVKKNTILDFERSQLPWKNRGTQKGKWFISLS